MSGSSHTSSPRSLGLGVIALTSAVLLGACAASPSPSASGSSSAILHVMVTNDDGVSAPGIDAAVKALRTLPHTDVTVVAPASDQSGTGGSTTKGTLSVSAASTASGYPAKAVHGYPADTVVWAIDEKGVYPRPELVVSGINDGQNIGPLAALSGTVGAARAAVARGIPALAVSQGIDDGRPPDFAEGAHQLTAWVSSHRAALLDRPSRSSLPEGSLNVPTCANGRVRGPVTVPAAATLDGINPLQVDCSSHVKHPPNDAEAFVAGFAVLSPLGHYAPHPDPG